MALVPAYRKTLSQTNNKERGLSLYSSFRPETCYAGQAGLKLTFPAPISGGSQLLITLSPGELTPSSGLCVYLHSCTHTYTQRHKNKINNKRKGSAVLSFQSWFCVCLCVEEQTTLYVTLATLEVVYSSCSRVLGLQVCTTRQASFLILVIWVNIAFLPGQYS